MFAQQPVGPSAPTTNRAHALAQGVMRPQHGGQPGFMPQIHQPGMQGQMTPGFMPMPSQAIAAGQIQLPEGFNPLQLVQQTRSTQHSNLDALRQRFIQNLMGGPVVG